MAISTLVSTKPSCKKHKFYLVQVAEVCLLDSLQIAIGKKKGIILFHLSTVSILMYP